MVVWPHNLPATGRPAQAEASGTNFARVGESTVNPHRGVKKVLQCEQNPVIAGAFQSGCGRFHMAAVEIQTQVFSFRTA